MMKIANAAYIFLASVRILSLIHSNNARKIHDERTKSNLIY